MRGFDRADVELLRNAFWPNVQINYDAQTNSFEEFLERHLRAHLSTFASLRHLVTKESVHIKGDEAHFESYVTARVSASVFSGTCTELATRWTTTDGGLQRASCRAVLSAC